MFNIDDVTIFNDLRERLAAITEEQISAAARKFPAPPKDGKVLGEITNPSTRALRGLVARLYAEEAQELAQAALATDENIERDHKERAAVLDMLQSVAKEMWWAQAKIDLGVTRTINVSMHEGWLLYETVCEHHGPAGFGLLRAITGGLQ